MLEYCKYKGIGVVAYSPLMEGFLARPLGTETTRTKFVSQTPFFKPISEADKRIIQRVEELAKEKGWKMSQVALAWVASKVTSPIVGANTVSPANRLSTFSTLMVGHRRFVFRRV